MPKERNLQVAIAIGVWADFALQVFGSFNSSPQTTELFAQDRHDTLWHWVLIADVFAATGGIVGSWYAGNIWPIASVGAVIIALHAAYNHALNRGGVTRG